MQGAECSGAGYLVEALRRYGVDTVFGAGGSTLVPLTDALMDASDIRFILAAHEFCTVAMADGYARTANRPGVAAVHVGPGMMNALGGMYSALRERSPVIVLCGQRDTRILGHDSLNEVPALVEIPRQCTKWSVQVDRCERLPEILSRAFQLALAAPQGPVFVSLPLDVMRGPMPDDAAETGLHVNAKIPALRGDPSCLEDIARRLMQADRPVVLMGSGVARARASDAIIAVAERLGIPILSEVPFSSLWDFPVGHPLYQGDFSPRSPLVEGADVILSVGGSLFQEKDYSPEEVFPPGVPILQINPSPWEIGKLARVEVAVVADERSALEDLIDVLAALDTRVELARSRIEEYSQHKAQARNAFEERAKTGWDEAPLKPWQVVKEVMNVVGPGAVVIEECVTAAESVRTFSDAQTLFPENRAGHLGWGVSGAIGVKLAAQDRPVVAFLGDGSFLFGAQGIWTAAKLNLPILYVVFRNRGYLVDRSQKAWERGDYFATELGDPDIRYADLAQSFGLKSIRVEEPTELRTVVEESVASGRPVLLECITEEVNSRRIFQDLQWQPWLAIHTSHGPG